MDNNTLIIYDDDDDILEICRIIFSSYPLTIITRNNSELWRAELEEFKPSVILMDNRIMPYGGVKVIKEIKASEFRHIPVIFFSAHEHLEKLAQEANADYLLKKPFDLADMRRTVENALKHLQ